MAGRRASRSRCPSVGAGIPEDDYVAFRGLRRSEVTPSGPHKQPRAGRLTGRRVARTLSGGGGASRGLNLDPDPTRTETHGSLQWAGGGAARDAGQSVRPRPPSGQTAHGCARSGCPARLVRAVVHSPLAALRGFAASAGPQSAVAGRGRRAAEWRLSFLRAPTCPTVSPYAT